MPSKKNKKSDFQHLIEVLYKTSRMTPDVVPSGWYRPDEIAKEKNISIWTAKRLCMFAVRKGKAETKFFKINVNANSKHVQRVKHFKLI
jgi:hypothetical protein